MISRRRLVRTSPERKVSPATLVEISTKQERCKTGSDTMRITDNEKESMADNHVLSWRMIWEKINMALIKFWYSDLPPLHGFLRTIFYALMWFSEYECSPDRGNSSLLKVYRKSIYSVGRCEANVQGIQHFANLGLPYKGESGIFGLFLLALGQYPSDFWLFNCRALMWTLEVGLALSTIGFGGRFPRVMVAVSYWILFGLQQSKFSGDSGHRNYHPAAAFSVLCFAENNTVDGWSLDSILLALWLWIRPTSRNSQQAKTPNGFSSGGAARKFLLFVSANAMLWAGMHKLSYPGFHWLDGKTLYAAIKRQPGSSRVLRAYFLDHPNFAPLLAIATVVGETAGILPFFYPWWRPFGVASFHGFHIGVMLLMSPRFYQSMVTYLLILDWGFVGSAFNSMQSKLIRFLNQDKLSKNTEATISAKAVHHKSSPTYPVSWRIGSLVYSLLAVLSFGSGLFFIDAFPFYSWCLFRSHPDELVHLGLQYGNRKHFTREEAQVIAHQCLTKPPLNPQCNNLGTASVHHSKIAKDLGKDVSTWAILHNNVSKTCPYELYKNWMPMTCIRRDFTLTLQQDLHSIMRAYSRAINGAGRFPGKISAAQKISAEQIRSRLHIYARDAAAASIEEGPLCFDKNSSLSKVNISSPNSAASQFASTLLGHLSKPEIGRQYLGKEREILAIGVNYMFAEGTGSSPCLLGSSVIGENYMATGDNSEVWSMKHTLPRGDYSGVITEIVILAILCCTIYLFYQCKSLLSCGCRLRSPMKFKGLLSHSLKLICSMPLKQKMQSLFLVCAVYYIVNVMLANKMSGTLQIQIENPK